MQGCSLFMRCQSVTPGVCGEGHSLFIQCQNLPPRNCGAGVQPVYAVSEPNFCELWVSGAACLCSVVTYHLGSMGHRCSLFIQCQNLTPMDWWDGRNLFIQCQNLPSSGWEIGMQPVYTVSEPTSRGLWGMAASCFYSVKTFISGTMRQRCSLLKRRQNLPLRTGEQGCNQFMWCWNILPKDCGAGVQPVYAVSEPTSWGLFGRRAACLYSVRTFNSGRGA